MGALMSLQFTFDPANVGHPIGFGAHATVKDYTHHGLLLVDGKDVSKESLVVKISTRPEFSHYLDREWTINLHLNLSPQIVRFFAHGTTSSGLSWILQPRLGDDLSRLTRTIGGQFSLKASLIIGLELLSAIYTIHNSGFVHCDVKPVCHIPFYHHILFPHRITSSVILHLVILIIL